MSREQRRTERRAARGEATPGGNAPPSRRTPVKVSGGSRLPIVPIGIAAGVLAVILLIVYLIIQSGKTTGLSGPDKAAADQSTSIPGTYAPNQGRVHFPGGYPNARTVTPFCPGVTHSGSDSSGTTATAQASTTPQATGTPATTDTAASGNTTPTVPSGCYDSNPPSSGTHLNVQNKVDLGNGVTLPRIPPDPNVYPSDIEIPREAIPHILEHAGVFVGYNCKSGDSACDDGVKQLTDLVNARIDNHNDRVVMSRDTDLPENTIGMSSWTRALDMSVADFDKNAVERFINVNSCRFDPEGSCK